MSELEPLIACAGTWRGTNRLWLSPPDPPEESTSTITVTPVLDGRFVRVDQTWAHGGFPQAGSLLVGFDAGVATVHWIDAFHMGRKVLACTGVAGADGPIDVRGTYAAPPGPDWGWRITIAAQPGRALDVLMFNVSPDGAEELAVEARHGRA
jgi:hypothetical protein